VTFRDDEIISNVKLSIIVVVYKERQKGYNTKIRTVRYCTVLLDIQLRRSAWAGLARWAGLLKVGGDGWIMDGVKPWRCPYLVPALFS